MLCKDQLLRLCPILTASLLFLLHKNAMKVKTSGFYFIQKACFILKINDVHHVCPYPPLEIKKYKKTTLTKTYICDVIKCL